MNLPPSPEEVLPSADDLTPEGQELIEKSPLERIREKRRRPLRQRETKLVIPNYGGELRAVYGYEEYEEIQKIVRRRKPGEVEADRAADLLCRMCRYIEIRTEEGEEEDVYEPLHKTTTELGSEPVRFDERLAKALDLEVDEEHPARSVVYQVFDAPPAVIAHQAMLILWLSDPEDEGEEQDFGQGSATTQPSETPST